MDRRKVLADFAPYFLAGSSTAICTAITFGLFLWTGKTTAFVFFFPSIMISTWYGGAKSGLLATMLSSMIIYYCFTFPYYSFMHKLPTNIIQLLFFIGEGICVTYIIDSGYRHEKIVQFKKQEKENKKYIQDLEQNLSKAQEEIASRDEFLSIASHELKTPLTTVLLQIQTTLHNIRNVSLAEFSVENLLQMLQSTQTQTKRLSRMINDLLNISLITTHKMELEFEEVDLSTLLQEIVSEFEPKFITEGTTITYVQSEQIVGQFDKLRIEQAFDNILSNALKYGSKKPVQITLTREKKQAVIAIEDHGIGISDADKEKIFLLFKRGVTEKDYKGLGVGLYIAQQIILQHGGKITIKSTVGKGTTFTITLPIRTAVPSATK